MAESAARTEPPVLALFSDFVCPFSWLAEPIVERLGAHLDLPVRYHAFELRPIPIPYPDDRYMRSLWERGVVPIMRRLGIEAEFPTLRTRTRKAHEAAAFAAGLGRAAEMRRAIRDAYFRDGRDIGRTDVLVELGAGAGLDADELRLALDEDRYADAVAADCALAARRGIVAVPAIVLEGDGGPLEHRVGWCDEARLRRWIEENLNTARA